MVHDQEEVLPNSRKRSYPFIQWINSDSPPQSRKSPDKESDEEDFPASLPSPPLQSNKYKIFKQDLDKFGGSLKSHAIQSATLDVKPKEEEKTIRSKTNWGGLSLKEIKSESNPPKMSPSSTLSEETAKRLKSSTKTDAQYKRSNLEISKHSYNIEKKEKHYKKARDSDMHVSSSSGSHGFDHDQIKKERKSFDDEDDEDEPKVKKPKYSVEIKKLDSEEQIYQPNIAESIKLRESKSRRNKSESYDESDPKPIKHSYLSSNYHGKERKSHPSSNTYKVASRTSSHPYIKKALNPVLTGSNIKVVSRSNTQANLNSLDELSPDVGEPAKIYIQIPQSHEKKTIYSNNISIQVSDKNDKNHNKVKKTSYEKRRDSSAERSFDEKPPKTKMYNCQTQVQRPSSTVVSSSTEINDEHDGSNNDVENSSDSLEVPEKVLQASNHDSDNTMFGRVTLQPQPNQGFWQASQHPHKDRPTPYSTSSLADRTYKQICRSRKFNTRYPAPEKPRQKRAVIQDMVRPLKQWLLRHRHNPYPTKAEKVQLAVGSNMTLVQVSNWFANARRRLKNVVQESRCSWSKRLRLYNQFVQGNAELLSISSDDSIWNSGDEENDDGGQSDTANTDDFELEDVVAGEHSYSIPGNGVSSPDRGATHREHQVGSYDAVQIDLNPADRRENGEFTTPADEEETPNGASVSSPGEHISATPTDSETPPTSPPDSYNIPDNTHKYKTNMLYRYLNDAAEAQESFSNDRKNSQNSVSKNGEVGSSVSDEEYYPDQSDISVGQELVYPPPSQESHDQISQNNSLPNGYETPPLQPDTNQWEAVDGNLIPASNNITISFTNTPVDKNIVPVISQPPRDDMGLDKVKRQLDMDAGVYEHNGHENRLYDGAAQAQCDSIYQGTSVYPSPGNPTVYTVVPQTHTPCDQFSTNGAHSDQQETPSSYQEMPLPVKDAEVASNSSSPLSNVSSPSKPAMFSPPMYRPMSVLPCPPGTYPFFPQGPMPGWAPPFAPFPHFLHLIPDSNCELAPPLAPPPWIAQQPIANAGSSNWTSKPRIDTARWVELDAAVALSQLASSATGCPPLANPLSLQASGHQLAGQPPTCT
eukprot:GFUD01030778.1.p1 GENE.GFUD01030778.1~~GFUD01030778.1.p1  ORF type:complete len:1096 (+),score=144.75 GFUD01030778.1:623-3910(+)